ncbi:hypothetical protein BH11MYX3_BH11MYX3_11000 [soil metagenome]
MLVGALWLIGGVAHADPEITASADPAEDIGDQAIGAETGIAGGGRVTPGGLRIAGHYLYQLSNSDWFDGTAAFTFGGSGAACFHDRMDTMICDHGFTDGRGVEISASVRRMFAAQGQFRPFARVGVGVALVQFAEDDVSGIAIPLHVGGGVRARVAPSIAVVAQGELQLGVGRFGGELGMQRQVGLAITAGAEFRLK